MKLGQFDLVERRLEMVTSSGTTPLVAPHAHCPVPPCEQVSDIYLQKLGEEHPRMGLVSMKKGELSLKLGHYATALSHFQVLPAAPLPHSPFPPTPTIPEPRLFHQELF